MPFINYIIYKTILGDKSDSVSGINGIGEKTLLKLFPQLKERQLTLQDIIQISSEKFKEKSLAPIPEILFNRILAI